MAPAPASASASAAGAVDAVRAAGTDNEAKAPAGGLDDPAFDCSVHIHASKTPRVINLSVRRAAIDDMLRIWNIRQAEMRTQRAVVVQDSERILCLIDEPPVAWASVTGGAACTARMLRHGGGPGSVWTGTTTGVLAGEHVLLFTDASPDRVAIGVVPMPLEASDPETPARDLDEKELVSLTDVVGKPSLSGTAALVRVFIRGSRVYFSDGEQDPDAYRRTRDLTHGWDAWQPRYRLVVCGSGPVLCTIMH